MRFARKLVRLLAVAWLFVVVIWCGEGFARGVDAYGPDRAAWWLAAGAMLGGAYAFVCWVATRTP